MEIQLGQLILQIINFGLLLVILTKFLYRPIIKLLEDRNKTIAAGLKAAETSLKEKETITQLKQAELLKAEQGAAEILESARKKAVLTGKLLLDEAKTAAQVEVQKEYRLLEEKLKSERRDLHRQVADLVVDTTKRVLEGALNKNHQRLIIASQIDELQKLKRLE